MDLLQLLRETIQEYGLNQRQIANESRLTPQSLSNLLNYRTDPKLSNFVDFVEAADRLAPGFSHRYWLKVADQPPELEDLVNSLTTDEFSTLLSLVAQRIAKYSATNKEKQGAA